MPAKIRCILDWQRGKYSKNPYDLLVRTKKNYVVLLSKGHSWINASTNTLHHLLATRQVFRKPFWSVSKNKEKLCSFVEKRPPLNKSQQKYATSLIGNAASIKKNPSDLLVRTKEKTQKKNKKKNMLQKRKTRPYLRVASRAPEWSFTALPSLGL